MTLDVDAVVEGGGPTVSASLAASPGSVVALLGPNGAGKSTILRAIAGLQPISNGHIRLDGRPLDEPAIGCFVDPPDRGIGVVFQDLLLFPSMSAIDNVAYGLRRRRIRSEVARSRAEALLGDMGLGDLGHRRPEALSGGQQQRVALARALIIEPRLLLLDEPTAALDAAGTVEMRRLLRSQLRSLDTPCVLVTHDPLDMFALADAVVVLEDGRVTHAGPFAEVMHHPRTRYVASLVGVNLYDGVAAGSEVVVDGHRFITATPSEGPVHVVVPPSAVALFRGRPEGSPRNVWRATVAGSDRVGDRVRIDLAGPVAIVAEVTPAAAENLDARPGETLWVAVKATEVVVHPR